MGISTKQSKAFDSIISSIIFWSGINNPNCAATLISMAEQLPLSTIDRERLQCIVAMYDALFKGKPYKDVKPTLTAADIPQKYSLDPESMYAYIMLEIIMNYISAELYNEASAVLLNISSDWHELYSKAMAMISEMDNSEAFCRWCASHAIVAMDVKRTNFLDYGTLAIMFDENGFDDLTSDESGQNDE